MGPIQKFAALAMAATLFTGLSTSAGLARLEVAGSASAAISLAALSQPAPHFVYPRPASARPAAARPARPALWLQPETTLPSYNAFRSVAVPVGTLASFDQWPRVSAPVPHFEEGCWEDLCATSRGRSLHEAAVTAAGLSPLQAIMHINSAVNSQITYRADRGDRWSRLAETARFGFGDCEDYALAKFELLRHIGFPDEALQFIVLKDTRKQVYHAVLAVHIEGRRYILDNLSTTVATDDLYRSYAPIVSFAGGKSYVHGFKGGRPVNVAGGGPTTIRPGNGG